MFQGTPIIGLAGGVGSGKSFVARLFGNEGCVVISSDELVSRTYEDPAVVDSLRQWWGAEAVSPSGEVNRGYIGRTVFSDPEQRQRLERLLHPIVSEKRREMMENAILAQNPVAFVWDTPLLFETSLNGDCDAVVFVDAPQPVRLARVAENRGWDEAELAKRENSQWPLDKKRELSDYVIANTADAEVIRGQVREVLSRILARLAPVRR